MRIFKGTLIPARMYTYFLVGPSEFGGSASGQNRNQRLRNTVVLRSCGKSPCIGGIVSVAR